MPSNKTAAVAIEKVRCQLTAELKSLSFGRSHFPHLFQNGLPDSAVHAAGVTYLAALGIEFGLPAIAEYPITTHAAERWRRLGRVFPDSVWFHPATGDPWVLFEFERFETGDENKIRSKAENLALAWHQSGGMVELCVFVYWLRSSRAPKSISGLRDVFGSGCRRGGDVLPAPGGQHAIVKAVACRRPAGMADGDTEPNKTWGAGEQLMIVQSMQPLVGIE